MAANAIAHPHFVMAGTRQRGGRGSEEGGNLGEEREGKEMGGWLLCTDLPFSIRSLVISTHRKKNAYWPE